jgi:nucleoside-diphosphate-sugar epimerase
MDTVGSRETILVTGASGQIGRMVSKILRDAGRKILPVDVGTQDEEDVSRCDLTSQREVSQIFHTYPIGSVIHLAGILPTAFQSDPLGAADVNLSGTLALMRKAAELNRIRFVFASSMSVYGTASTASPVTENDPAIPDDAYGASKRAIELIGENLRKLGVLQFVSLRIARVVGPGIKKSSSSQWRSQIFETRPEAPTSQQDSSIRIPYPPEAVLSLVHVEDVARMLVTLLDAPVTRNVFYNSPVELWTAEKLKHVVEEFKHTSVTLDASTSQAGALCDGNRFVKEFGFQLCGLREHLAVKPNGAPAHDSGSQSH